MLIAQFLKGVVERRMSPKNLTGPIGIAQLSGEAAAKALRIRASDGHGQPHLAIFNLLPMPHSRRRRHFGCCSSKWSCNETSAST